MGATSKIFTKEELEFRNQGLVEVKKIFELLKIPFILTDGTLLGIYRDNEFIAWDNDVDISLKVEDVCNKLDVLFENLKKNNFVLKNINLNYSSMTFRAYKYGTRYEFTCFYEENEYYKHVDGKKIGFIYKKTLFDNLEQIKFKNHMYFVPSPIEDYLIKVYGSDWRKPKKSNYLTHSNKCNFDIFTRLIQKVKRGYKKSKKNSLTNKEYINLLDDEVNNNFQFLNCTAVECFNTFSLFDNKYIVLELNQHMYNSELFKEAFLEFLTTNDLIVVKLISNKLPEVNLLSNIGIKPHRVIDSSAIYLSDKMEMELMLNLISENILQVNSKLYEVNLIKYIVLMNQ